MTRPQTNRSARVTSSRATSFPSKRTPHPFLPDPSYVPTCRDESRLVSPGPDPPAFELNWSPEFPVPRAGETRSSRKDRHGTLPPHPPTRVSKRPHGVDPVCRYTPYTLNSGLGPEGPTPKGWRGSREGTAPDLFRSPASPSSSTNQKGGRGRDGSSVVYWVVSTPLRPSLSPSVGTRMSAECAPSTLTLGRP